MWAWLMANSVWILFSSGLLLVVLFLIGDRLRERIINSAPEGRREKLSRMVTIAFWAVESLASVVLISALVALVVSREGVHNQITPETIELWFLEHGSAILIILIVGTGLWYALKRFLPLIVQRTIVRPKRGESREGMKKRADTLRGVFMGLGKIIITLFVIFMILADLEVPIGPILAGFGVAGIAVGFGAQYLIRDLIAGIFILMENQYRVGDVARVADIAGLVEEVNLRKTVLRDLDGIVHHIPNGEIKVASNYTRHFSRVNLNVAVSYGTDLDHAIRVINRVCEEMAAEESWKGVIKTTPKVLRVDKWADSAIEIKILGDVKPLEQWSVMGEMRLRLKKAFDVEGIEIPWPHTKVYFGNSPWDSAPPGGH